MDLSGDGKPDGTLVDSDGDGVSDGINLTGGTTPNLLLLDTNGDGIPDAVDSNGDGLPDYYISPNPPGFLTTGPGGTGNPVVIIVDGSGNPIGFDTDGDGTPNDTAIVTILSDTTPPTITSSLLAGTFSTTQTTTLTCSDNKAPGSIVYTLDTSAPAFSPKNGTVIASSSRAVSLSSEGSHTLSAICRDLAGNVSTPISIVYTIDTKIPALTIVSQSSLAISSRANAIASSTATWRSDRSGSFTVREGSSCETGTIATTGTATANVDQTFVRSHTHFTGEGTKTYRICVTASNGLTGFVSITLQRDDTVPVVTADPGAGSYGTATSVSFSCSDTGGSGCEQIAYAVQTGSSPTDPAIQGTTGTVSSGTLYTAAIAMTDGTITYTKFVARDKAGNVSSVTSQNYTVDTEVATITVNSHSAAISISNASISWQTSKAGSYQIRLGGSNCSTGTALTNTGFNTSVAGVNMPANTTVISSIGVSHFAEGDNTIRICVANLIGSFGSTTRITNKDTTAPVVTMASPSGSGPFASGTQLQLSCSDTGGSGCDKVIYTLNGTEPALDGSGAVTNGTLYSSPVALSNGSNQVKYLARDLAGNLSTAGNQSFHLGPPNAPAFVEAQAGGTSAFVQWWPVSGATSYTVYYSTSPGVTTSATSFGPVTDPYATITGLASGTLYYFRVIASNAVGVSEVSVFESMAFTTTTQPGTSATNMVELTGVVVASDQFNLLNDTINDKYLIISVISSKLTLYRCNKNDFQCSQHDISANQPDSSASKPSTVIDTLNHKLLVTAQNFANNNKLSLYRCNLDGTNCSHSDISAGQGSNSGTYPSTILDPINSKILTVTTNGNNNNKLSLFKCNLDGRNCSHSDISAGQGTNSGYYPKALLNIQNNKLFIIAQNVNSLGMYQCNMEGIECTHSDIKFGSPYVSAPDATIDFKNQKIFITAGEEPSVLRICNFSGSFCSVSTNNFDWYPSIAYDQLNEKVFISSVLRIVVSTMSLQFTECNGNNLSCNTISLTNGSAGSERRSKVIFDSKIGKFVILGKQNNKATFFIR